MTNDTRFYFKDVEPIIGKKFAYILANSRLEKQSINGREFITVLVDLEGYDENNRMVFRIAGCPYPPCKPQHLVNVRD